MPGTKGVICMAFLDKCRRLTETVDFFHGIDPTDLGKLMSFGVTKTLREEVAIFNKGDAGTEMYVILEGGVKIVDGDTTIATLGPGDTFGEMAVLAAAQRSADAVTTEITNLFILSEDQVQRLMGKRVAIRILLNIVATLSKRLREMDEKMSALEKSRG